MANSIAIKASFNVANSANACQVGHSKADVCHVKKGRNIPRTMLGPGQQKSPERANPRGALKVRDEWEPPVSH
jgi:hypothetical protein